MRWGLPPSDPRAYLEQNEMADRSLDWPFFEDRHRGLAAQVEDFAAGLEIDHSDIDVPAGRW